MGWLYTLERPPPAAFPDGDAHRREALTPQRILELPPPSVSDSSALSVSTQSLHQLQSPVPVKSYPYYFVYVHYYLYLYHSHLPPPTPIPPLPILTVAKYTDLRSTVLEWKPLAVDSLPPPLHIIEIFLTSPGPLQVQLRVQWLGFL
ncbi:hypothetical protein AXG93_2958s1390 [Marchantia polymorpha subsp. ruderalis]|uniref:Uncharacterized protein n=1 Tax=Marchantia polymorpha subsp. ruderalis TaxID=1480154 RepID=A0A176VH58_MARPO|nr:hypothetical protein AXG93_2958s1390 [Marchantia polymorpha subsp. ruderalis]